MNRRASRPDIELTIDELNLVGFDPRARAEIGDHVLAHLHELLAREPHTGLGTEPKIFPRISIGEIPIGVSRKATGVQIAQRIHRELVATPFETGKN